MRNGTIVVSVALHGAIAIAAFVLASRSRREAPPPEDLVFVELAPPEVARANPASPLKAPEVAPPAMVPRAPAAAPARLAATRTGGGTPRMGSGAPGGGLGVLAGEGDADGFEMNAEPGDGDGKGNGGAAAPEPAPPPPPPPPKPVAARPREPQCGDVTTKPKPLSRPRSIEYPEAARAAGKEGRLLLQLVVSEDGSVGQVDVLSGVHPALDSAAIAAVKTWRFEPASRCGKPVGGGTYRVARRFELGD